MGKSINKVTLLGNLTKEPELRYTGSGTAVASFTIATNRSWKDDSGQKHEESDFHKVIAWAKLAEICSQYLKKGSKCYVEGRLQNRSWEGDDGIKRFTTEIVIDNMVMLNAKGEKSTIPAKEMSTQDTSKMDVDPNDIPF